MNARLVEWDIPFKDSVLNHPEQRRLIRGQPKRGCIITARYHGVNVRLRVIERDGDKSSIAEVIGLDDQPISLDQTQRLQKGDMVVVPDSCRAIVRYQANRYPTC